jgi:hypothetical protein
VGVIDCVGEADGVGVFVYVGVNVGEPHETLTSTSLEKTEAADAEPIPATFDIVSHDEVTFHHHVYEPL